MKKFLEEIERQGIVFADSKGNICDLIECDRESFIFSVGLYEDNSGNEDDEEFNKLHKLIPTREETEEYWDEYNELN